MRHQREQGGVEILHALRDGSECDNDVVAMKNGGEGHFWTGASRCGGTLASCVTGACVRMIHSRSGRRW